MSFLAATLSDAIAHIVSGAPAGPNALTADDLVGTLTDIQYALTIISDVLTNADNASRGAVTAATDAATQVEEIGQNVKDITERTYKTVLPHSMSWLAGYIVSHFIEPLKQRVTALEQAVDSLLRRVGHLEFWREKFVDPNLTLWVGFREWFLTWPQSVLFTVHDWLEHPHVFGLWAAPPLIGPLVSYLAAPEHKETRDNLVTIIMDGWREEPEVVWREVQEWVLGK